MLLLLLLPGVELFRASVEEEVEATSELLHEEQCGQAEADDEVVVEVEPLPSELVRAAAAAGERTMGAGKNGEMVMRGCSSGVRRARVAIMSSGSMGVVASAGGDARPVRSDSGSGPWSSSLSRQPTAPK